MGCMTLVVGMWRRLGEIKKGGMYCLKDIGMDWILVNNLTSKSSF